MSDKRMIYAEELKDAIEYDFEDDVCYSKDLFRCIDRMPTIDPETLPIVQELREYVGRVNAELIAINGVVREWQSRARKAEKELYAKEEFIKCQEHFVVSPLREKLAECEPAVHGNWIVAYPGTVYHDDGSKTQHRAGIRCSQCFERSTSRYNFCPNCGAKMVEVER